MCALLFWLSAAQAATITYVYDELGRLVGVVDPGGDTAVYRYDAVGNLLSITRYASATVSIIEFTPNQGPVNTTVTIAGTGFSPTPSQNTVTFNGLTATVTSSTATQIVTKVPAGATTGPIAVTAPGGSATSADPFTVTAATGPPTISGFSPAIAAPGTSTTISGTNFDPTPANDKVKFNASRFGGVTAATATSLTVTVPVVGSGKVSVTTPGGTATSSADFFVPPAPYTAAQVEGTGRLVSGGGTQTVTTTQAGNIGLIVFDGVAGQGVTIEATSLSTLTYFHVHAPDGSLSSQDTSGLSPPSGYRFVHNLPATGTHTILVKPAVAGTATLKVGSADLVVTTVTVPGAPIPKNPDGSYTIDTSWTVQNQGNITAPGAPYLQWYDRVWLSTDPVLGGDTPLDGRYWDAGLAPGASYSRQLPYLLAPPGTAPGTYYIIVEADSASPGGVPESNEANNWKASAPITLLP